jgi:hypothetical protein
MGRMITKARTAITSTSLNPRDPIILVFTNIKDRNEKNNMIGIDLDKSGNTVTH